MERQQLATTETASPLIYVGKEAPVYRERLSALAEENRRTVSGEIRVALDTYLAMHAKPGPVAAP
jgi:argininosuccinate synthase